MPRVASALLKLLLLTLSLALSFVVLELFARSRIPWTDCPTFEHRLPDPVYGWRLEPGARFACRSPEATFEVVYNSAGWRDLERTGALPADALRVVVLGDSFMEAYSVDLGDAFARRLVAEARLGGAALETVNLGVGGYGTLQEYLVYRDFGARHAPHLVLLAFYAGNDLANNSAELERLAQRRVTVKTEIRPFLVPDAPGFEVSRGDFEAASRRFAESRAPRKRFRRRLRERSVLYDTLVQRIKLVRRRFGDTRRFDDAQWKKDSEMRRLGGYRCREPGPYTRAWALTRRIFEQLRAEVEASGARLVVFTVPALEEVDLTMQQRALELAIEPETLCLEEAPQYARLGALLAELGIPLIDLLPVFREEARERDAALFKVSDRHWSREGHALAARTVARALFEQGLLGPPPGPLASGAETAPR